MITEKDWKKAPENLKESLKQYTSVWYRDMISIFDELDIAWDNWCYCQGFGFWDWNTQKICDQGMLDALLSGKGLEK